MPDSIQSLIDPRWLASSEAALVDGAWLGLVEEQYELERAPAAGGTGHVELATPVASGDSPRALTESGSFTSVCCNPPVKSTRIAGSKGLIEATIDGLTFYRTEASAAARKIPRRYQVDWDQIATVDFDEPTAGKAAVRITLVDDSSDATADGGLDPYVLKVRRRNRPEAREFVRVVREEITQRQRWIRPPPAQEDTSP